MTDEKTYQLIEDFLAGKLSEADQKSVKKRIAENGEFAHQVQTQQQLNALVVSNRLSELKARMQRDINKEEEQKNRGRLPLWVGIIGAISLGLIIYFLIPSKPQTTEEVTTNNEIPTVQEITGDQPVDTVSSEEVPESTQVTTEPTSTEPVDNPIVIPRIEEPKDSIVLHDQQTTEEEKPTSENEQKEKGTETQKSTEPDCDQVNITFDVTATSSCSDENTGSITCMESTIKGGKAPYKYALTWITQSVGKVYHYRTSKVFTDLAPGSYQLRIKDANGCKSVQEELVEVETKSCGNSGGILFSPENDNVLKFTVRASTNGKITIYNQAKIEVKNIEFGDIGRPQWFGDHISGSRVANGLYLYVIDYEDGITESGHITVY